MSIYPQKKITLVGMPHLACGVSMSMRAIYQALIAADSEMDISIFTLPYTYRHSDCGKLFKHKKTRKLGDLNLFFF